MTNICQLEFGSVAEHSILLLKDRNEWLWFLHSRGSWWQLQQMYGHTIIDLQVLILEMVRLLIEDWALFMGRVSTSRRSPQSCISNVSLSWFKTFSILVWLFPMLLHLGSWRKHLSFNYIENVKFTSCRNLTRDNGACGNLLIFIMFLLSDQIRLNILEKNKNFLRICVTLL